MLEMDQHWENNHLLKKGSYGGRSGWRSIDPVIVYVTQVEIAMITPKILVRYNNDATACFDRIMSHILCLFLQSYQMPAKVIALLSDFLQYAKYAIKTANGV